MSFDQMVMVSLEELVKPNHVYRKFKSLLDFKAIEPLLLSIETDNNYKGYSILPLFKCFLTQFMEDLSEGELEMYLSDNNSAKWL